MWEIDIAIQNKINIIPFYVDGLSSTDIERSNYYKTLPDSLKVITSSAHHDLKYIPGGFDAWFKTLIRSLKTTEEVYRNNRYQVDVEATHETEVYDEDELDTSQKIRIINFGKKTTYWVNMEDAIMVLRFKHFDSEGRCEFYKITIDTIHTEYSRPDDFEACYRLKCEQNQRNALFRMNKDGVIKIFMDWGQIDQFKINRFSEDMNPFTSSRQVKPYLNFVDKIKL